MYKLHVSTYVNIICKVEKKRNVYAYINICIYRRTHGTAQEQEAR